MTKIVLIRHGESQWNQAGRFTGWVDVDLSPLGFKQSRQAGAWLKKNGFSFDLCFTSFLKRTIKTATNILDEMDLLWLPLLKDWRLNEKHYGGLQGLSKKEMAKKFGQQQVLLWRRSYDLRPPAIKKSSPYKQMSDSRYQFLETPVLTESLLDVEKRVTAFWRKEIVPRLKADQKILIVASGNSLRALMKYLADISAEDIVDFNIPVGVPIQGEINDRFKFKKWSYLGNPKKIKGLIKTAAGLGNLKH